MIFLVVAICCFSASESYAQSQNLKKITGKVVDAKSEPIIGATVVIEGSTNGIVTNVAGGFELTAPVGSTIKVTYIGFTLYQEKITTSKNNLRNFNKNTIY